MTTATAAVPTTFRPGAREMARELGVEAELDAILDAGQTTVRGLVAYDISADSSEMGPAINVIAYVDEETLGDPSHFAWWNWRIDAYGVDTAALFVVGIWSARRRHAG